MYMRVGWGWGHHHVYEGRLGGRGHHCWGVAYHHHHMRGGGGITIYSDLHMRVEGDVVVVWSLRLSSGDGGKMVVEEY